MMASKTIWKFPVPMLDVFPLSMPQNAKILCVQTQRYEARIWALVDPDKPMIVRDFRLVGTGHLITESGLEYIGTFQIVGGIHDENFVGHLFERTE